MNFVNEYLSADDYEKYIEPYKAKTGIKSLYLSDWTIDKEANCFLVNTHRVRQDMYEGDFSITLWLFLFSGEYIKFEQHTPLGSKRADGSYKVTNIIKEIDIPQSLQGKEQALFAVLKEAMEKSKGVGVFGADDIKEYELSLDVSEVIIKAVSLS